MSNNLTPEQQAAYKLKLADSIKMYDVEIQDFKDNITAMQTQIQKYQQMETQHPLLKIGIDQMIRWTNYNINQKQRQITEYEAYKQRMVSEQETLNPIQKDTTT